MERQRQHAEPMVARLMNPGYPIDAVDVGLIRRCRDTMSQ
jgi:hypothetical protein